MSAAPDTDDTAEWAMRNRAAELGQAYVRVGHYYWRLSRATSPLDIAMLITNIECLRARIKDVEERL